ncbi:MAG TPA: TrbI/VirB10 family protein [Ferrovibrio sp.]|uniref:TrbI/VirB10 family protein n=1 Tax=Ferrovibrio sp. TaxID=1917215 RepID=UPI002ED08B83
MTDADDKAAAQPPEPAAQPFVEPAGAEARDGKQSGPAPEQDSLDLPPGPRPVVRFNRTLMVVGAACLLAALFGATFAALRLPGRPERNRSDELYAAAARSAPDSIAGLPKDYGELRQVPPLGPPQPPAPGMAVLRDRQNPQAPAAPPRPDPDAAAARAERQRLLQRARQAREAGVFFRISTHPPPAAGGALLPQTTEADTAAGAMAQAGAAPAMPAVSDPAERLRLDTERDQNNQQRKLDFLNAKNGGGSVNPHPLQPLSSPYLLMAGSVIAASLVSGINSDLPGLVKAQVTENVYDTATGQYLLIPQGSQLVGRYDSVIAYGQSRALLAWQRILLPNGDSIVVDNLPAADTAGYAGLSDDVDYHVWRLAGGVALSTLLDVGTELSFNDRESDLARAIRESFQQNASRAGQRLTERNLNLQPTITIRPGWPLRVLVHKDLALRPYRG